MAVAHARFLEKPREHIKTKGQETYWSIALKGKPREKVRLVEVVHNFIEGSGIASKVRVILKSSKSSSEKTSELRKLILGSLTIKNFFHTNRLNELDRERVFRYVVALVAKQSGLQHPFSKAVVIPKAPPIKVEPAKPPVKVELPKPVSKPTTKGELVSVPGTRREKYVSGRFQWVKRRSPAKPEPAKSKLEPTKYPLHPVREKTEISRAERRYSSPVSTPYLGVVSREKAMELYRKSPQREIEKRNDEIRRLEEEIVKQKLPRAEKPISEAELKLRAQRGLITLSEILTRFGESEERKKEFIGKWKKSLAELGEPGLLKLEEFIVRLMKKYPEELKGVAESVREIERIALAGVKTKGELVSVEGTYKDTTRPRPSRIYEKELPLWANSRFKKVSPEEIKYPNPPKEFSTAFVTTDGKPYGLVLKYHRTVELGGKPYHVYIHPNGSYSFFDATSGKIIYAKVSQNLFINRHSVEPSGKFWRVEADFIRACEAQTKPPEEPHERIRRVAQPSPQFRLEGRGVERRAPEKRKEVGIKISDMDYLTQKYTRYLDLAISRGKISPSEKVRRLEFLQTQARIWGYDKIAPMIERLVAKVPKPTPSKPPVVEPFVVRGPTPGVKPVVRKVGLPETRVAVPIVEPPVKGQQEFDFMKTPFVESEASRKQKQEREEAQRKYGAVYKMAEPLSRNPKQIEIDFFKKKMEEERGNRGISDEEVAEGWQISYDRELIYESKAVPVERVERLVPVKTIGTLSFDLTESGELEFFNPGMQKPVRVKAKNLVIIITTDEVLVYSKRMWPFGFSKEPSERYFYTARIQKPTAVGVCVVRRLEKGKFRKQLYALPEGSKPGDKIRPVEEKKDLSLDHIGEIDRTKASKAVGDLHAEAGRIIQPPKAATLGEDYSSESFEARRRREHARQLFGVGKDERIATPISEPSKPGEVSQPQEEIFDLPEPRSFLEPTSPAERAKIERLSSLQKEARDTLEAILRSFAGIRSKEGLQAISEALNKRLQRLREIREEISATENAESERVREATGSSLNYLWELATFRPINEEAVGYYNRHLEKGAPPFDELLKDSLGGVPISRTPEFGILSRPEEHVERAVEPPEPVATEHRLTVQQVGYILVEELPALKEGYKRGLVFCDSVADANAYLSGKKSAAVIRCADENAAASRIKTRKEKKFCLVLDFPRSISEDPLKRADKFLVGIVHLMPDVISHREVVGEKEIVSGTAEVGARRDRVLEQKVRERKVEEEQQGPSGQGGKEEEEEKSAKPIDPKVVLLRPAEPENLNDFIMALQASEDTTIRKELSRKILDTIRVLTSKDLLESISGLLTKIGLSEVVYKEAAYTCAENGLIMPILVFFRKNSENSVFRSIGIDALSKGFKFLVKSGRSEEIVSLLNNESARELMSAEIFNEAVFVLFSHEGAKRFKEHNDKFTLWFHEKELNESFELYGITPDKDKKAAIFKEMTTLVDNILLRFEEQNSEESHKVIRRLLTRKPMLMGLLLTTSDVVGRAWQDIVVAAKSVTFFRRIFFELYLPKIDRPIMREQINDVLELIKTEKSGDAVRWAHEFMQKQAGMPNNNVPEHLVEDLL